MAHPQPLPVAAGQESVWDYPRPPRIERVDRRIAIVLGGETIVDTTDVARVLETSHPPVYYLPASAFVPGALIPTGGTTVCEFKGGASYFDVRGGAELRERAAWTYPVPEDGFDLLLGRVAVYARPMDACTVDGMPVEPQPGRFYGGWITPDVVGPFKGAPGSMGW
jgi:uncharacterized protein (DUF427 family)